MKLSTVVATGIVLSVGFANAFTPIAILQRPSLLSSSQLNLFGGGNKDGEKKEGGGGMMNQLTMFKKAQEMAQKKQKIDQELAKESFKGSAADGKVTSDIKFQPSKNPMDPQPNYDAVGFDFDEDWYDSASPEEIGTAVKEALLDGINITNLAISEKYKILGEELQGMTQEN